jgi:hypothetical protein
MLQQGKFTILDIVLFGPHLDVFVGAATIELMGLLILWRLWREARRLQMESLASNES